MKRDRLPAHRERDIQNEARLELTRRGTVNFRNNRGTAWQGERANNPNENPRNILVLRNPRPVHFGLCDGASDLIGWTPVIVTQEMVGRVIAVFSAFEMKSAKGRASDDQLNFLAQLSNAGGIAALARSPAEAVGGIEEWFRRKNKTS